MIFKRIAEPHKYIASNKDTDRKQLSYRILRSCLWPTYYIIHEGDPAYFRSNHF